MAASASQIDRQRRLQARFRAGAKRELAEWVAGQDTGDARRFRDALAQFLYYLANRWGDMAAAAAADWFEDLRADAVESGVVAGAGATGFAALLATAVTEEQASRAAVYAVDPLFGSEPDVLFGSEPDVEAMTARASQPLGRWVKDAGARTVIANAAADRRGGAKIVRVPRGDDTCAFCLMLASRGFLDEGYLSKLSAEKVVNPDRARFVPGDLVAFHDDCDCEAVVFWGDEPPEAWDGERYAHLYETAAEQVGNRGDTAGILAAMRQLHGLH